MVPITQNLVSSAKYGIKCPYTMTPTRIVVHNTANDASAANEIKYMISNNNEVSFHYAVDDRQIVQGVPVNRNTWNAGDGNGKGNREGISIEICYSLSGGSRFVAAEKNAAEFIAKLLRERGWGVDKVTKHQDYNGKYCPHRTLDMGWQRFINMIKTYLGTASAGSSTTAAMQYKVGDVVTVSSYYASSTDGSNKAVIPSKWQTGTITRIVPGARNPYLLNNGSLGWCNAGDIRSVQSSSGRTYTVQPGDSWWSIANKQLGDGNRYAELAKYNGMTSGTVIHPGQIIKLP